MAVRQVLAALAVLATNPVLAVFVCGQMPYQWEMFGLLAVLLGACLLCTGYLFARTGRVPGTDDIQLGELGRLPPELLGAAVLAMPLLGFALIRSLGYYGLFVACVATAGGGIMLACLLALARKWKAGRLVDDCLLVRHGPRLRHVLGMLLRAARAVLTGENYLDLRYPAGQAWLYRILWVCGAMAGLVVLSLFVLSNQLPMINGKYWFGSGRYTLFALFAILVVVSGAGYLAWRAYRDARAFDALLEQLDIAARGGDAPVCVPPDSGLYAASQAVAQIGIHLRESVDAQIKSERMKLDLITNVSHDLKTPLTSIIGYLDLLEKQEGLPAETRDYILILRRKSERLAETVADLFTLAKATSGSETLEIEPLDLVMAVRQTLGDLTDAIRAGGVPVKTSMPASAIVRADSAKLYRVLQNILDNALRYSLPGTRIYLEVSAGESAARLSLTNTASYEMAFTPEEVLQRFVRGDASRTTEGSGLGLSIAQTFMQNFGGDLSVEVRGDAFTVALAFPNGELQSGRPGGNRSEVFGGAAQPMPEEPEENMGGSGDPAEPCGDAAQEPEPLLAGAADGAREAAGEPPLAGAEGGF